MVSAAVIGCTGLVGSYITKTLIYSPAITRVYTFSRRSLEDPDSTLQSKVTSYVSSDSSNWLNGISNLSPPPDIFFSAFGTTRAAAGSFENQYRIEHGLHLDLARAAKQAGCKVFVLVSSSFANHRSLIPYARMKGEIEQKIKALHFERTVILHPGMILGSRSESRPAEAAAQSFVGAIGALSSSWKDCLAQDAHVIAKAAVNAGLNALEHGGSTEGVGESEEVRVLNGPDILRLERE